MKRNFVVLRQLLISYLAIALTYRADFIQSVLASVLWSAFSFLSAYLVTSQTPAIFGLTRADLLLLASTYGIIVGIHHWLFTRGFHGVWHVIHRGELDGYLLRPFNTLTFLSLRSIAWGSVFRVAGSVLTTAWIINHYGIIVEWWQVVLFSALTIPAILAIYAFYSISVTVLIWHPYLSNLLDLMGVTVSTARYPLDIVRYTPIWFVGWIVPFLAVVNMPTRALTNRLGVADGLVFVGFCFGLWLFSRWFWRYALKFYTSASG